MMKAGAAAVVVFLMLGSCSPPRADLTSPPGEATRGDLAPFACGLRGGAPAPGRGSLEGAPLYELMLAVSDDLGTLSGVETVRYTNTGGEAMATVDLVLLPNIARGSLAVESVSVGGAPRPITLAEDGMVLRVVFPRPLEAGESLLLSIRYRVSLPRSPVVGFGGLQLHEGILSLAYAYPMIPAGGRWRYGRPPSYGDLTANPASYYLVTLSYPRGLTLASPGVLLSSRASAGRKVARLAFGPARDVYLQLGRGLETLTRREAGIELRAVVRPSEAPSAEALLRIAGRAVSLYERLFGPYPYRTLTFVGERFGALGLEFPGIILITSWLYGDGGRTLRGVPLREILEATVAHEVAHQWFYALLGSDQLGEPWLDESFAQWATLRYYRDRYGERGETAFRRSLDEGRSAPGHHLPLGLPLSAYTPRQYGATIYGLGPLFLEQLARRIGEARFDRLIAAFVAAHAWGIVTGEELRQAAEPSCGCSLARLWEAWIYPVRAATPATSLSTASVATSAR